MIEPKDDLKELRQFATTLFIALGALGAVLLWQEHASGFVLWAIGSVGFITAWVRPAALRGIFKYWMKMAVILGFVSSHVILTLLFYMVLTPIGLARRLVGKKQMYLQPDERAESYWVKKPGEKHDRQRYEKMY